MELLLSNVTYRKEIEQNAIRRAHERFNLRVTVKNHLDWCEEAFAQRPHLAAHVLKKLGWLRHGITASTSAQAQVMPPWILPERAEAESTNVAAT